MSVAVMALCASCDRPYNTVVYDGTPYTVYHKEQTTVGTWEYYMVVKGLKPGDEHTFTIQTNTGSLSEGQQLVIVSKDQYDQLMQMAQQAMMQQFLQQQGQQEKNNLPVPDKNETSRRVPDMSELYSYYK
jgi:hypothetical protein